MRGRVAVSDTKPCEFCGTPITRTKTQQSGRRHWTCGAACSTKLAIQGGRTPRSWKPNPVRGQKGTRPCAECGKPVARYLSEHATGQIWTCSKHCKATRAMRTQMEAGTWVQPKKPRRGDTIPCDVCGVPFYRSQNEIARDRRFCSRTCVGTSQSKPPVIKHCPTCGKEMILKPSQAVRIHCSKLCEARGDIKRPLDRMHNGRPAKLDPSGYVMVWEPTHPNKSQRGWQYEHRLVAEAMLDRYLTSEEHVHHKNEVKDDNRPENLQVLDARSHNAITMHNYLGAIQDDRDELARLRLEVAELRKQHT